MDTENSLVVARRECGEWVKLEKGIKRHKFPVIKEIRHWDAMYSIGNIVNNIVTSLCGDRW